MLGVTLGCSIARRPLDEPSFEPFWAELDRRGTVVFLHPVGLGVLEGEDPHGLTWMIGAPVEDTVAALRLVMSGLISTDRDPFRYGGVPGPPVEGGVAAHKLWVLG
jgi:aminocarboxymuconate-semialdehyde decarboxylase